MIARCRPLAAISALLAVAAPALARAVEIREAPGALHGFPSMSNEAGDVIADGELTQERRGNHLVVNARWKFEDGMSAAEEATFALEPELAQLSFSWVESDSAGELRRFEVDFETGRARAVVHREGKVEREEERLELPRGRAFTGYGTALAASQLALRGGESAELTFVAFTPKPRTVTLEVRNDGSEDVTAAGRRLAAEHVRLHPKLPFPISVFVDAPDAHLWFTRSAPRALLRARQNLVTKDDPQVTIDVIPRGPATGHRAAAKARAGDR